MRRSGRKPFSRPANRLANHQQEWSQDDAGRTHDQEGHLPSDKIERRGACGESAVPTLDDLRADEQAKARADVDARRVQSEHSGALPLWKQIGEHRIRGGGRGRFTHAHADTGEGELGEAGGEARECGHQAPEPEAGRDHGAAVADIGQQPQGNAEDRVEDREGRAVEEAELRVAHPEISLDPFGQNGEDLAIDEVEDVDDDKDGESQPGPACGRRLILTGLDFRGLLFHGGV